MPGLRNLVWLSLGIIMLMSSDRLGASPAQTRIETLIRSANDDYQRGLYETAARKFSEAYEVSGDPNYLYDAAISFQQVQRWDECIGYLGRYLEIAPISPKRDRARNAQENCKARQARSQKLIIETTPLGAQVRLSNLNKPIVGTTPVTLELPPGVQRVFIEKEGFETVIRDVDLQMSTPLRLTVELRELNDTGYLFVDSQVTGATVFLNGESSRLTPFVKPIPLDTGVYQLHINRVGYSPWTQEVKIESKTVHHVPVLFSPLEGNTSWRTPYGWLTQLLGGIAIGMGVVATNYADKEYRDTARFKRFARFEKLGYGLGSSFVSLGLGLVIWDAVRDPIPARDKNPSFMQPFPIPADAVNTKKTEVMP